MAGGLRKDVELIFRGTDRASPTIKGVRQEVSGLSTAIAEQIAAAERGEGTIDDLARAYKALQTAQGDVTDIAKLATAYDALVKKHAEQAAKADEARQKEAQLSAQIEGAEAPTKRLINARDAAARSAAAAAQKETELATQVKVAGEAFESAGGDLRNFERSQDAIRAAALETARALTQAGDAMQGYKAAQGRGNDAKAAIDEANRFNAQAAGSGLPEAQIAFISGLENKIEALSAAMRENEASAAAMNKEIASREADAAASRIRAFGAALDEAEQKARALESAMAFKSQAADIEARARDVARFGANADTGAASANRMADAIQNILAPTNAAARTLDGLDSIIVKAEGSLEGTKRRLSEYNDEINNLAAANAGLQDIARSVDAFENQATAVGRAQAAFDAAQGDVLQYAAAIKQAAAPTDEMARSLTQAEAKLETAGAALRKEQTALTTLEAKLEAAGVDTRNLATAQDQLTGAATRAAAAQSKLQGATSGRGSFLGLNPHEMTNLGFQVNDIVVGLASGQKPLTVLVQQGAQIGQIFPGAFSAILRFIPLIAGIAAVFAPLIGAMKEVSDEGRRMDSARANLASMGEVAAGINPAKLEELAEALEEAGLEADEANGKLRQLMADGLDTGQMEQYIAAAKAMADVTGVELSEAMDTVRSAFQGGFEDIAELDAATNAFTDSEMDLIEQLYEQGRADEARATALEIYANKMQGVADDMEGPWGRALKNIKQAWENFTSAIGATQFFVDARREINELAIAANYLAARLAGKTHEEAGREAVNGVAPRARQVQVGDPNRRTAGGQRAIRDGREQLETAQATTAAEKRSLAGRKALNAAISQGATNREAEQARALALGAFDAQEGARAGKRADAAGKRAEAAAKRRARAAETAARQIANTEEQLRRQLETLDSAVARQQTDSLETRLTAIDSQYAKLFRDIDEYSQRTNGRGQIGDRTIEQAREHVELQQRQLKNYATLEFREKQLGELMKERNEALDAIDDKVARGIISPEDGLAEADAVINRIAGRVNEMAVSAIAFAEGLRSAVPNPALEAFIAKMRTAVQNNAGGQNVRESRDRRMAAVTEAEQGLNELISRRSALIENENLLVSLGLQTRAQAQTNIEGHYNRTSELIKAQIANVRALAGAFANDADPAMRLYFETLMAQLESAELQTQFLDANFVEMKNGIDQLLTTNIIGWIDAVAQAFVGLAAGKMGVLDFFASIGLAFLDMIAKTLQGIAQLILQMIILDTVEKFTGIPVKGLLKLYGGAGIFHEGGLAGHGNRSRNVSPLAFANAPRYHSGGIAGFAPNEVAAVLKKNEEVLTENDPRHRFNGGLSPQGGAPSRQLRQVLAFGDDQIAAAMAGPAGEDVTVTHIRRNKTRVRQELGIS